MHGFLPDPTLELYDSNGAFIISNDNWRDAFNAADIQATGIAPSNDLESAILASLNPNLGYTAIVRGNGGVTGTALIEIYDLNPAADALLANLSTRGFVEVGDNVMIGGVIIGPNISGSKLLIRALGPSLTRSGISNPLSDPMLELHDGNGATIASNDNWRDAFNAADIQATGLAPPNDLESAILLALPTGPYTAIVAGKDGGTGIGLVEIYDLQQPVAPLP